VNSSGVKRHAKQGTLLRRGSFILNRGWRQYAGIYASALMACSIAMPSFASSALALTEAAQRPALAELAQSPYWRSLLRDENPRSGNYSSAVSFDGFFLSPNGSNNALAELEATANEFAKAITPSVTTSSAVDTASACRYPGRHAWLSQQRPDLAAQWPKADCPELNTWLTGLDANQVTLVFASDYLNNPSSMFGHTLMRIDAASQSDDTRLLSYAINYSAQTNTNNGLEFAIKGLTGGYPGAYSLLPYYEKVKEYNDWESRDLWEYELALTPTEVRQMLLVFWDWRGISSPYYFLSRNCSYELLGLIEMARPGLDLQSQFPVAVIPTDTVRAVLKEKNLLKRVTWRAASGTQLQASLARNDSATNAAAKRLSQDAKADFSSLAPVQRARALEVAYDDLYTRHVNHKAGDVAPLQLRSLLTQRAALDVPNQRIEAQRPAHDPSQGHGTARVSVGAGYDDKAYALLAFRPAYHDWLDSTAGYRAGARIDFLSGSLRADDDGLHIEQFTVVGIDSLAPINALSSPLSWSVRFGVDRRLSDEHIARADRQRHSATTFEGGGGIGWGVGNALCYSQSHSRLQGGSALSDGWEVSTGLRSGCTGGVIADSGRELRWLVDVKNLYAYPAKRVDHELRSGLQWSYERNQAIEFSLNREWRADALSTISLQWHRYF
jgi:hypothetical protein